MVEGQVVQGLDGDAGRFHVQQQHADALVLGGFGVGTGCQQAPVGLVSSGGPYLLAVDHELVAFDLCLGLERRQVRAGVGLAVQGAPVDLFLDDGRNELFLLLVGAIEHQQRADPRDAHAAPAGGAPFGHLLVVHQLLGDRAVLAAVLLWPRQRQPPFLDQLLAETFGELVAALVVLVGGRPVRWQLLVEEVLDLPAEFLLDGAESKVHQIASSKARPSLPRRPGADRARRGGGSVGPFDEGSSAAMLRSLS